jgi:CheY-like chemotaxis protein
MAGSGTVVAVIDDLMFQSRLREHARRLGYSITIADTPASAEGAFERQAALAVVDLHITGLDWRDAVASAKAAGVPVLAFGRHTEAALLREARDAGCDRVVPRSTFVEELDELIGMIVADAEQDTKVGGSR